MKKILYKSHLNIIDVLRIPFTVAPVSYSIYLLNMVLNALLPLILITVTADFLDSALAMMRTDTSICAILSPLLRLILVISLKDIAETISIFSLTRYQLQVNGALATQALEKKAKLHYQNYENNQALDLCNRVCSSIDTKLRSGIDAAITFTVVVIRVAGILLILSQGLWWAGLLEAAVSIPSLLIAVKSGRANYVIEQRVSGQKRKYSYLSGILSSREAADERYLFGYADKINRDCAHSPPRAL